eukprot:m51a1_g990 hypothetical protein (524) ;mRNA; f:494667-496566
MRRFDPDLLNGTCDEVPCADAWTCCDAPDSQHACYEPGSRCCKYGDGDACEGPAPVCCEWYDADPDMPPLRGCCRSCCSAFTGLCDTHCTCAKLGRRTCGLTSGCHWCDVPDQACRPLGDRCANVKFVPIALACAGVIALLLALVFGVGCLVHRSRRRSGALGARGGDGDEEETSVDESTTTATSASEWSRRIREHRKATVDETTALKAAGYAAGPYGWRTASMPHTAGSINGPAASGASSSARKAPLYASCGSAASSAKRSKAHMRAQQVAEPDDEDEDDYCETDGLVRSAAGLPQQPQQQTGRGRQPSRSADDERGRARSSSQPAKRKALTRSARSRRAADLGHSAGVASQTRALARELAQQAAGEEPVPPFAEVVYTPGSEAASPTGPALLAAAAGAEDEGPETEDSPTDDEKDDVQVLRERHRSQSQRHLRRTNPVPQGHQQQQAQSCSARRHSAAQRARPLEEAPARCVVCLARPARMLVYPCGHCCLCEEDATRLAEAAVRVCPMCRTLIRDIVKVH